MTLTWHGPEVLRKIQQAADRGKRDAAELLLAEANRHVPVDTGELRNSGHIEDGDRVVYDAPYAAIVHERMDVHHPDGEAKWLETAGSDNARRIAEKVAEPIRRLTR